MKTIPTLPTTKFSFFNQFSREQIINQIKKNVERFEYMLKKAKESITGKYNGYTPEMLKEIINDYKKKYEI